MGKTAPQRKINPMRAVSRGEITQTTAMTYTATLSVQQIEPSQF
jgi:hypothetical protein